MFRALGAMARSQMLRSQTRRYSSVVTSTLSKTINQAQKIEGSTHPELVKLETFKNNLDKLNESMYRQNSLLTGKDVQTLSLGQVQQSFALLDQFVRKNPYFKTQIQSDFNDILIGASPVSVKNSNDLSYQIKTAQKFIEKIDDLIYEELPSRYDSGVLTDYGRRILEKLGDEQFLKAMQLVNDQFKEETSFTSMTKAKIDKETIFNLPIYWDQDQTYVKEFFANKNQIPQGDLYHCTQAQLALFDILEKDGHFDDISNAEIKTFKDYIIGKDEYLVHPNHIQKSNQNPLDLFHQEGNKESKREIQAYAL